MNTSTTPLHTAPITTRVAVLGIGMMGFPMARRLCEAGCAVSVWNRSRTKAERLLPFGATVAETPADAVAQAIAHYGAAGTPLRAVMLERLGPNVWHDTPAAAMATLEELEETARLWSLLRASHPLPDTLNEEQISELRQVFSARW